jgi:hypothetical protein
MDRTYWCRVDCCILGPSLWFDEVKTGYLYTGAFVGSIISGLLSDWINRVMIKLNGGTYEPEFRIILVFFQLLFSGIGLYGFGIVAQDVERYGWLLPDVFFAFVVCGMVMGAVASARYIVDAYCMCYLFFPQFICARLDWTTDFTPRSNCGQAIHLYAHAQEYFQLHHDLLCVEFMPSLRT